MYVLTHIKNGETECDAVSVSVDKLKEFAVKLNVDPIEWNEGNGKITGDATLNKEGDYEVYLIEPVLVI